MSNLLDKICKVRDLMISDNDDKLKYYKMEILKLKEELHRQIKKKAEDYKHELDFTSQDLRELSEDIRNKFKQWADAMNPEENTKMLIDNMQDNTVDPDIFYNKVIPVMITRTETIQVLTELLNIAEYHAVYLYLLEEASDDKFALRTTVRF